MECFPSPYSLSLRGAKRRSNLIALALTSQARQDCFAALAMTGLKCDQSPFPLTGENMECFPSPCSLSLRGAKRRSNLVAPRLTSQVTSATRLLRCARNDEAKMRSITLSLDGGKHGMLPLTMFPVIARSEATKQSRSTTTYITSTTRLLRCARNDKAKMQSSSLPLSLSLPRQGERGRTNYAVTTLNFRISPHP